MYQQKVMPYNQINDVYEEDQYLEEDSQPLIQEVDTDYQPTQKQVRQYAIKILGMNLPEDQRLTYLARQGLKAPLPSNWQPYQGRDGQVYYKHKITQQKTYQHPTDVEYKKKYIQQKERVARKNLKSLSLKNNPLSGLGPSFSQQPLGAINLLDINNLSQDSMKNFNKQGSKIDSKIEEQLHQQLKKLEKDLKNQYEQFELERKKQHENIMRKHKLEFEQSLTSIKQNKSSQQFNYNSLKQQKQRLQQRLKQAYKQRFTLQLSELQSQQQKYYQNYITLYEQDYKIRLKKYQQQIENQYNDKLKKFNQKQKNYLNFKIQKNKQKDNIIKSIKINFQQDNNEEIQSATIQKLQQQLQHIRYSNSLRIKDFQKKLQNQFIEIKKLLGHDPNQTLQEIAQKKNRLKKISQQKIQSLKKKQFQKLSIQFSQKLSSQMKQLQSELNRQYSINQKNEKEQYSKRLKQLKKKYDQQKKQQLDKKIQQIYQNIKIKTKQYQKQKNKKIISIRQQFISDIVDKNNLKSEQLKNKINTKDKEDMIENKQLILQSITKQIQLENQILKQLQINHTLSTCPNIDQELKKLIQQLQIIYKPQSFLKYEARFNSLKQKYKSDKQLLASMMNKLQSTSYLNFYDQKHLSSAYNDHSEGTGNSTISSLVKQYNKDVRVMRNNEDMLARYEISLRKAELNDQEALLQLEKDSYNYEQISLKAFVTNFSESALQEISNSQQSPVRGGLSSMVNNSYESIQDQIKSHSKFLSTVKAQLNRKLYKVRSNNYYKI